MITQKTFCRIVLIMAAPVIMAVSSSWAAAAPATVMSMAATPPAAKEEGSRPKIAIVLGGGAARGFSHIGLIQAFEENGIPIDMIVGTSMGSIVGGLYAAGFSTGDLQYIMDHTDYATLFDLSFPPHGGVVDAHRFGVFLDTLFEGKEFGALKVPFYAVITNLANGEEVALNEGPVSKAILASMSIPVLFPPVEIAGKYFVDGGMKNAVPVNVARRLGADVVIGVDVKKELKKLDYDSLLNNLQLTMYFMIDGYVQQIEPLADVIIVPDVKFDSYMEYDRVDYFIQKGYEAAQKAMPRIKGAIAGQTADFPYYLTPPAPDHPQKQMEALLSRAYAQARQAPRHFSLSPVFKAQGGSHPQLAAGLAATGGAMGAWRASYGYRWNLARPAANYHAMSVSYPIIPTLTAQGYVKSYPADASTWPGAALLWKDYTGWHADAWYEASLKNSSPRWRAEVGKELAATNRLAIKLQLTAGQEPMAEIPTAPAEMADVAQERRYAAAQVGVSYSLVPNGWPFWELGVAYPQIIGQVEHIALAREESLSNAAETWLGVGGALDVKLFGLYPLRLRLLAKSPPDGSRFIWTVDLGQTVTLP